MIMNNITQIITKQSEIIENLAELNAQIIKLLSQYMACEEYENKLEEIMNYTFEP